MKGDRLCVYDDAEWLWDQLIQIYLLFGCGKRLNQNWVTQLKTFFLPLDAIVSVMKTEYQQPHFSRVSPVLIHFPLSPDFYTLLMFCPPPSCVCCLIAEPPSPRPWDPPGSMYHLLHHLSLLFPLSSSPWFPSTYLMPVCFHELVVHCRAHSLPPSRTQTAYAGHSINVLKLTLHITHIFDTTSMEQYAVF